MTRASSAPSPAPQMCLLAEVRPDVGYADGVAAALAAVGAATLILAPSAGRPLDRAAAAALVTLAQARGVAALVVDDPAAAREMHADGVHLSWSPEVAEAYGAARAALGPKAIVGAEAGRSRHDAMLLGEAGADYVAFGLEGASGDQQDAYAARLDLVDWWAELFEIPVVALDVETAREAKALAEAGADFVAVTLPHDLAAGAAEAWAAPLIAAIRRREAQRA